MNILFFSSQEEFRKWLEENYQQEPEAWVGFYKVGTGKPSMSWSQSVDQALCFGWIDGIRKSVDAESYCIRFTPRRKNSIWSTINIRKVEELTNAGLMTPAGLKAFGYRTEKQSEVYSYEQIPVVLDPEYEARLKAHPEAWHFFEKQAPSYKKMVARWVMSAKQEKTRLARLDKVIAQSLAQQRM